MRWVQMSDIVLKFFFMFVTTIWTLVGRNQVLRHHSSGCQAAALRMTSLPSSTKPLGRLQYRPSVGRCGVGMR